MKGHNGYRDTYTGIRSRDQRGSSQENPDKVSGNPNVFKEAAERKKGGKLKKKRALGGKVLRMSGGSVKSRLDRPGRRMGGGVGANSKPLSSAHATVGIGKQPKTQEGGTSS